jgi:hypothetical protein
MKLAKRIKKALPKSKATKRTLAIKKKVAVGGGAALAVAGLVGVALKIAGNRKRKAATARADAAQIARMESEGGGSKLARGAQTGAAPNADDPALIRMEGEGGLTKGARDSQKAKTAKRR